MDADLKKGRLQTDEKLISHSCHPNEDTCGSQYMIWGARTGEEDRHGYGVPTVGRTSGCRQQTRIPVKRFGRFRHHPTRVAKDRWKMSFEYWYATSSEGRVIRYGYKELSDGVAAISATVEGRSLMILQRSLRAPLTRAQVEALFEEKSTVRDLTAEEYRSSAASGC